MTNDLSLCESPIERMLGDELVRLLDVVPQHEVDVDGRRYRLDFAVIFGGPRCFRFGKVAIECDGHDFHERTKEQAAHDRSRDRALTRHGWTVLRFTGSALEARLGMRAPSREDGPRRATPAQTGTRSSEAQRPATGHAGPAKGLYVTIRPDRAESAHSGTMGRRHG